MKNFIELVALMREAQKNYFKLIAIAKKGDKSKFSEAQMALKLSKSLETRVDEEINKHSENSQS